MRRKKKLKVRYRTISNFKNGKYQKWLEIWSKWLFTSVHVIKESPESLRNKLKYAVFAFVGERLIGAGGLMLSHDADGKKLKIYHMQVIEFRSVYVHPNFRKKHIAEQLQRRRLSFIKRNNFLAVTLTREPNMPELLKKLGWLVLDDYITSATPELRKLKKKLRVCGCEGDDEEFIGERCQNCPYWEKISWFYPYGRKLINSLALI